MMMIRLSHCTRATMTLTLSQIFLGAITFGIASFRGSEAHVSFHYATQVGHANYAASRVAADHARAANAVATNNAISAAIMGPRFAVEADNITMDEDASIACPQWGNPYMQMVCARYQQNKPRALAKLTWVRAKQAFLWSSLGKLSGDVDRLVAAKAAAQVGQTVRRADSQVSLRFEDPSSRESPWGASNTAVTCTLAQKDALASNMPGSAFPLLMPTLLQALPRALVQSLPGAICGALSSNGPIRLPEVPTVAKKAREECRALEDAMRCAVSGGRAGAGCGAFEAREFRSAEDSGETGTEGSSAPVLSSELQPFVECAPLTPSSRSRSLATGGYTYRAKGGGALVTCTFDRELCNLRKLESSSASYLKDLGLPSIPDLSVSAAGTRAPSDPDWNHSDRFRACAFVGKPIDDTIASISDATRIIVSFGQESRSDVLRERREYQACGKWYFPDAPGTTFGEVPHDQQAFVAAWKWAVVAGRNR